MATVQAAPWPAIHRAKTQKMTPIGTAHLMLDITGAALQEPHTM
jgi:hypothetical protein